MPPAADRQPPGTTGQPPVSRPPSTDTSVPTSASPAASVPVPGVYQHVLGWSGTGKVAHLTFDDGPGPYTDRVLDILAAKGVRATFCQIGEQVGAYPAAENRIVAHGHQLCNHSWDHPLGFGLLSVKDVTSEIARTEQAIGAASGVMPGYFRAPGGRFGQSVKVAATTIGTHLLGWGADTEDWKRPGVDAILANAQKNLSPGVIILMHDGGGDRSETLAALPLLIDRLRNQGYTITPLPVRTPTPGR